MNRTIPLTNPGRILLDDFILPLKLTRYKVAQKCGIPQSTMTAIIKGTRPISNENAMRLERFFGLSDGWISRLQADYEMRIDRREKEERIKMEVRPFEEEVIPSVIERDLIPA